MKQAAVSRPPPTKSSSTKSTTTPTKPPSHRTPPSSTSSKAPTSTSKKPPQPQPQSAQQPQAAHLRVTKAKYDSHKTADTLTTQNSTKFKTAFSAAYARGSIPCHINHGSVNSTLTWSTSPAELDYAMLLPLFAEGLVETTHPYVFISRLGFKDMLGAEVEITFDFSPVCTHLRTAMKATNQETAAAGADALLHLVRLVGGDALLPNLRAILVPLKALTSDKKGGPASRAAADVLRAILDSGGPEVVTIVKTVMPTAV